MRGDLPTTCPRLPYRLPTVSTTVKRVNNQRGFASLIRANQVLMIRAVTASVCANSN